MVKGNAFIEEAKARDGHSAMITKSQILMIHADSEMSRIKAMLFESIRLKQELLSDFATLKRISSIAEECVNCLKSGGKIIFAGNGGSFADAQHLAAELVARFSMERSALAAMVLGANSSTLTAIANDYSFDDIYSRELSAIATSSDVFIPLSTSGCSQNILNAVSKAHDMGLKVFGISGKAEGLLSKRCEVINVDSSVTARVQEVHIVIGHILCELIEVMMFS